jgi:hypothetical protein
MWRHDAALTFRKLTRGSLGGQPIGSHYV